jgi:hypothetical protein
MQRLCRPPKLEASKPLLALPHVIAKPSLAAADLRRDLAWGRGESHAGLWRQGPGAVVHAWREVQQSPALPPPPPSFGTTSSAAGQRSTGGSNGFSGGVGRGGRAPEAQPSATPASPQRPATGPNATQVLELLQETAKLAVSTGPRGFVRGLQAAQALLSLVQEYARAGMSSVGGGEGGGKGGRCAWGKGLPCHGIHAASHKLGTAFHHTLKQYQLRALQRCTLCVPPPPLQVGPAAHLPSSAMALPRPVISTPLGRAMSTSTPTPSPSFVQYSQATTALDTLPSNPTAGAITDTPPVVLRRLFERLGSTYIKLGQFIASSPSLFPDEYVLEFQKCLDKTEPVPYDAIRRILEQARPCSNSILLP